MNAAPQVPPRGFGPVMRDDEGREYQVTEDEVWSAAGATAGMFIGMAAWDFSSHAEWIGLHGEHLYFGAALRFIVRWTGVTIAAVIVRSAWREQNPSRPRLQGRDFEAGRRPGWDRD